MTGSRWSYFALLGGTNGRATQVREERAAWMVASRAGGRGPALLEGLEGRALLSAAFDLIGLSALRADAAYGAVDGSSIGVAVIDTGLYAAHPDIAANVTGWYDALTRSSAGAAFDPSGHGTHVAGIVASSNPEIGVAYRAHVVPVRVLPAPGESQPRHDALLDAFQWVINNAAAYNIRVVNLSLGTDSNLNGELPPSSFSGPIGQLESLGITVVAASGNSYAQYLTAGSSAPGAYATLNVASVWEDGGVGDSFPTTSGQGGDSYFARERDAAPDRLAATSQRSTLANQVAAPGATIYSLWNNAGNKLYNTISGTSMASPMVAGAAALMQDAAFTFGGVYLSAAQVQSILISTADVIVDYNVTTNGRVRMTTDSQGRLVAGAEEALPETGLSFRRVNVYNAVRAVRTLVTGVADEGASSQDTNNTIATASIVPAINGTRMYGESGEIGRDGLNTVGAGDVDLYRIVLDTRGVLSVEGELPAGGTGFAVVLRLFNAAGELIANAGGGAGYPTLTTQRLEIGTYYLGVSGAGNTGYAIGTGEGARAASSQGDYTLTVGLANPDPNGVVQGAVATRGLPDNFNGLIGSDTGISVGSQDVDFFEVVAPDTGVLTIDINARRRYGSAGVDSYVRVFDEQMREIAFNDDRADGNTDSFLTLTLVRGQRVFVSVADFSNRDFDPADPYNRSSDGPGGRYDISLAFDNGDNDGTVHDANIGEIGRIYEGVIGDDFGVGLVGFDGSKDVDFYKFKATADGLLDVTVTSPDGSLKPGLSVWVYSTQETDFERVSGTEGDSARRILQVVGGRTYYFAVTGQGNGGFRWYAMASGTGGDTGAYRVQSVLRALSDMPKLMDGTFADGAIQTVSFGASVLAEIGGDGNLILDGADIDLYRFIPTQTMTLAIRTDAPVAADNGTARADTFLRIFDEFGNELRFNDDASPRTTGSGIVMRVEAGKTYYIGISANGTNARAYSPVTGEGAEAGARGPYILTINDTDIFLADPLSQRGASAGADGSQVVTTRSASGRPIVFVQGVGGDWEAVDLATKTTIALGRGVPKSWVDPKDGLVYAATVSAAGRFVLFTRRDGGWTARELDAGSPARLREAVTFFVTQNGLVTLAALDERGDLIFAYQDGTRESADDSWAWTVANISASQLRAQGQQTPAFAGELVTYVTGWNGLNIAGLDVDGNVWSVWWAPDQSMWQASNLTAITGAPRLAGGLTAYVTSYNAINIVGLDTGGRVAVTWWVPGFGSSWVTSDLTAAAGGPALIPETIASFVTPWDATNIAGVDPQGNVSVYWWAPGGEDVWRVATLTTEIQGARRMIGPIAGVTSTSGVMSLVGSAETGEVLRYLWDPALDRWTQEVLTELAVVA